MVDSWSVALGVKAVHFISGAIGGVLSLRWVEAIGWQGRLFAVLFAGVIANYSTAPVYTFFAIKGLHEGGVGLFIGLFSMSLAAAMFKALQEFKLVEVFNRITGVRP